MTADKNYGPAVSGYLVPDQHAWETVVTQAGKPLLDIELNLSQDIDGGAAQAAVRRLMPSGWLSDDFLTTSSSTGAIFAPINVANTIEIPPLLAHVNGWFIPIQRTNSATTANRVNLSAGPGGGQQTNLVILEVWRRLIPASPASPAPANMTGKSPTGRIWFNGNVKIAPGADDATYNFDDDILNVNVGVETTKRVQIQYRLRAIADVDVFTYPSGIDDFNVVARTVPPNPTTPDGSAYPGLEPNYTNQWANGDTGLWRAGDGVPTNGLGTVDGYMYAIPLLAVFRRNTAPFNRATNQNGGAASPGTSDRPDGLFNNIIAAADLLDLRHGVSPTGWSLEEVLEKNTNAILDNSLRTEITDNLAGGGSHGTTVFVANEIGGTQTPAVPAAEIQQFDAVRRRFSDRSIYETVTLRYPAPGGGWVAGSVVTIGPTSLLVYPYAAFDWSSLAPDGSLFLDVVEAHWAGPSESHKAANAEPHISITGLGSAPVAPVVITIAGTVAPLGLTDESLYVTLLVAYPRGVGLTHTPVETYGVDSFELTTAPLPSTTPIFCDNAVFDNPGLKSFDEPHREVQVEYQTLELTYTQGNAIVTNKMTLPERAIELTSVSTAPVASATAGALDPSGRIVTFNVNTPATPVQITVKYKARRPIPRLTTPAVTPQLSIYFRAAAPQMARGAIAGISLTVVPKLVSGKLISLTAGSGSQGEAYPFPTAYLQTGGIFPPVVGDFDGEAELAASPEISVANFDASTGMLCLPTYISMVASPESLTFQRGLGDIDVEGRSYFTSVPLGAYVPNAYAQDLSNSDRHKNVLAILAELTSDTEPLGRRGQLVIILLIRYALFDETNGVFFDSESATTSSTTASVFRVKGLLLNKRAN